jgi:hypothetical protein
MKKTIDKVTAVSCSRTDPTDFWTCDMYHDVEANTPSGKASRKLEIPRVIDFHMINPQNVSLMDNRSDMETFSVSPLTTIASCEVSELSRSMDDFGTKYPTHGIFCDSKIRFK